MNVGTMIATGAVATTAAIGGAAAGSIGASWGYRQKTDAMPAYQAGWSSILPGVGVGGLAAAIPGSGPASLLAKAACIGAGAGMAIGGVASITRLELAARR